MVRRGDGLSLVAGYPWFTDWGRDTFISLRGLCLATGRLEDAVSILSEWAQAVSIGMLPNRFPDRGELPEFNSVDASLWFIVAVDATLEALARAQGLAPGVWEGEVLAVAKRLAPAVEAILSGYAVGTRHGIRASGDGLLAAGEPGQQLTWMDARSRGQEVTPRIGKPVEIQALWLNALAIGSRFPGTSAERWKALYEIGARSFGERFWNAGRGCLYDVVDTDHVQGATDGALRPNQILAVGGLPLCLLDEARARAVVDAVEAQLLTPLGLRSLAPGEPGFVPHYQGGGDDRDAAYHQGTVWPWLMGAFIDAWVRVRGNTQGAKDEARKRFLAPLQAHLREAGLGHVSEVADAMPPHRPAGCPFQAWSLGELLWADRVTLGRTSR